MRRQYSSPAPKRTTNTTRFHAAVARALDQGLIADFLADRLAGFHPTHFERRLESPGYEPNTRVLLWGRHPQKNRTTELAGHARLAWLPVQLGPSVVAPMMEVAEFVVAEFVDEDGLQRLWEQVRAEARRAGAVGLLRAAEFATRREPLDWFPLFTNPPRRLDPRSILASLHDRPAIEELLPAFVPSPYEIRLFRLTELDDLQRLYAGLAAVCYGALERTTADWQWLLQAEHHDHLFVALGGDQAAPTVAGYAATKGPRILELAAQDARCGEALLRRFCQEALELDHSPVLVHPPLLLDNSGAAGMLPLATCRRANEPSWEACCLSLPELASAVTPGLSVAALQAGLPFPLEFGLRVDDAGRAEAKCYCWLVDAQQTTLQIGRMGRSYIQGAQRTLARILLGQYEPQDLTQTQFSSKIAHAACQTLFPKRTFHKSAWDCR